MKLEIELVEAARGTTRSIDVTRQDFCSECRGAGARKGTVATTCNYCGGRGQIVQARGFFQVATTCPACGGEGVRITDPCPNCRGSGRVPSTARLQVDIPPGVESGMWLQLRNQGELGEVGAPRGHLRIQVLVKKHPFFERQRNDLICQVPISFAQAALGAMVEVPTLDGREQLEVPRGTSKRRRSSDQGPRHARYRRPGSRRRAGGSRGRDPAALDVAPGRAAPRVCRDRALCRSARGARVSSRSCETTSRRKPSRKTRASLDVIAASGRPIPAAIGRESAGTRSMNDKTHDSSQTQTASGAELPENGGNDLEPGPQPTEDRQPTNGETMSAIRTDRPTETRA